MFQIFELCIEITGVFPYRFDRDRMQTLFTCQKDFAGCFEIRVQSLMIDGFWQNLIYSGKRILKNLIWKKLCSFLFPTVVFLWFYKEREIQILIKFKFRNKSRTSRRCRKLPPATNRLTTALMATPATDQTEQICLQFKMAVAYKTILAYIN